MSDRLTHIEERLEALYGETWSLVLEDDIQWLIDEVKRLRRMLASTGQEAGERG